MRSRGGSDAAETGSTKLSLKLPGPNEEEQEAKAEAGIVKLSASAENYSDSWSIDWRVERTDIQQDMFRQ